MPPISNVSVKLINVAAVPAPPTTTYDAARSPLILPSNPRLRSSVACARCRRSKIKCVNAGADTTCEACAYSGRECVYLTSGVGRAHDTIKNLRKDSASLDEENEGIGRDPIRRYDAELNGKLEALRRENEELKGHHEAPPGAATESHSPSLRHGVFRHAREMLSRHSSREASEPNLTSLWTQSGAPPLPNISSPPIGKDTLPKEEDDDDKVPHASSGEIRQPASTHSATQWSSSYVSGPIPAQGHFENTYPYYSALDLPAPPMESQKGPYKCRWCERIFAHESSKCRHEKEHSNSFPCPEPGCDVVSWRKDSLKRHLRLMHGDISDFQKARSTNSNSKQSRSESFKETIQKFNMDRTASVRLKPTSIEAISPRERHEPIAEEQDSSVYELSPPVPFAERTRELEGRLDTVRETQKRERSPPKTKIPLDTRSTRERLYLVEHKQETGRSSPDIEIPSVTKSTRERLDDEEQKQEIEQGPPKFEIFSVTKSSQEPFDTVKQRQETERNPPEIKIPSVTNSTEERLEAEEKSASLSRLLGLWSAAMAYLLSAPLSPGKGRLKWQCSCGHSSYDDFHELRSGALVEMQSLLEVRRHRALRRDERSSGERLNRWRGSSFWSIFLFFVIFCANLVGQREAEGSSTELPQHLNEHGQGAEVSGEAPAGTSSSLHVLLSFPYYSHGSRLYQPHIKNMGTDRDFFKLLRVSYNATRNRFKRLISLKTIRSVKFVQLESFRPDLVDIRKVDDLPPPADSEYVYDPKPPELVPPVGENLMLHLFLHPDHADAFDAVLLKRIPKKNNVLSACPVKGSGLGWGIHFGAGWHYGLLWFCLLLLTILCSLVFLVCWAIFEQDVQGASGVAGYALVLITTVGGSLQAGIEMEIL